MDIYIYISIYTYIYPYIQCFVLLGLISIAQFISFFDFTAGGAWTVIPIYIYVGYSGPNGSTKISWNFLGNQAHWTNHREKHPVSFIWNQTCFQQSLNLQIQNVYANKKLFKKKAIKLCIRGQIGIGSHSFLKYWQNR